MKQLLAGSITLIRGGRPLRLATSQQLEAFFDHSDLPVDFVIVDTPPGEVEIVDAALRCADLVVVPVKPSPLSLTGLCDVADLVRRQPSPLALRSVLTRAHRIRISTRYLAERVERLVPGSLCRTMIPEDARVVDSPDFGLPVTLSHRRCRASVAYRELVEELYPVLNAADAMHSDEAGAVAAYGVERRRPAGPGFAANGGTNVEDYMRLAGGSQDVDQSAATGERLVSVPLDRVTGDVLQDGVFRSLHDSLSAALRRVAWTWLRITAASEETSSAVARDGRENQGRLACQSRSPGE